MDRRDSREKQERHTKEEKPMMPEELGKRKGNG